MILPGIGSIIMSAAASGNIGTWDPAATGTALVLSNGNLTQSPSGTGSGMALNTVGRSVGKLYAEAVMVGTAQQEISFGFANASANLNNYAGASNAIVIYQYINLGNPSSIIKNATFQASGTNMPTGTTIGAAVDFSMGLAWFLVNGVSADGSVVGSTGGYALPVGTLFVAGTARSTVGGTAPTLTLNTSPTYGPPATGFVYWV